ncbi:serine/threonine protein kinase [Cystobacter fuscus]|uniref:serine/threonine protein kinase n=1 Tax=Cystobacter fuscus TaxID=43 RepID=UPI002B2EBED1|nr:protein kinase [Cystobacter fuscus]
MNPSSSNARLRPFRPVPFGRYTLLTQLATGGMGEIFLARLEGMQGFEKLCVIKKILPQLAEDPEFVERFVGEARTLVKLTHGSIAQVLDMGLHEGDAYMALEYVDGKDLRKVAARARDRQMPLPLTFVLFVMGRVLDALAYAHRKKGDDESELNLVHRDISPQNILISYEGEVKVIDFGLAKSRLSAAKTNPSIILGKFLYMSPEQARHLPVDRRSDLYAVGLCLYELLSGKNPFDSLPPGELMSAVAHPNIPPLSQVAPGVPDSVSQLVMKALAVEPAQRFQAAEELRGRLNACLLELDSASGPESISRYMQELFASEYLTERRMLVMLREVGRVPEPEPEAAGVPEGAPPRSVPMLPPKTIRLDGPVEPLSFKPTPRTREGAAGRDEGETRPAVAMEEPTAPGAVLEGPTRPAVPLEAIEESRSERPSGSHVPTLDEMKAVPEPPPAFLEGMMPRTLEDVPPPIEDTPGWSESLPPEEPLPPEQAPSPERWRDQPMSPPMLFETEEREPSEPDARPEEEPAYVGTDLHEDSEEGRLGVEDTQPRIQMPLARTDDTQPRVVLRDVYHEDTQPRVVLDESLLRDTEEDDVPPSQRPKSGGSRVPRRRVVTTGVSRPSSVRRAIPDDLEPEDEGDERTEETPSLPSVREPTASMPVAGRRAARPRRRWVPLVFVLLGVLLVVGLWASIVSQQPAPRPPPARSLARPTPKVEPPAAVPPPSAPLREEVVPPAPSSTPGAVPSGSASDAGTALDAGMALDAGAESSESVMESDLLFPLAAPSPEPEAAPSKAPTGRKPRATRGATELQKEWARTRLAYERLTRVIACDNLSFLCSRYESLEHQVEQAGDAEDPQLLGKVRQLQRDLTKRRNGS